MFMTVVCGALIAVGIAGVVVPVLPGSVLIIVSLLLWALTVGSTEGWVVFAIGTVLAGAGLGAGVVLTGRTLRQRQIPGRSVTLGVLAGIVGMFVIPVVGLFVGFALGLFASEFARQRNARAALTSSLHALKATGLGILAELGLACLAGTTWVIGVWVYFVTS
ncbi:membrane protein [Arthrobacter sp. MN05-02]|nr:membrane protein [Arthrobacter sp. MN05-02]